MVMVASPQNDSNLLPCWLILTIPQLDLLIKPMIVILLIIELGVSPFLKSVLKFVVCIGLVDLPLESIEKDILTHNYVIDDYRGCGKSY